jgi:hypothetical protein
MLGQKTGIWLLSPFLIAVNGLGWTPTDDETLSSAWEITSIPPEKLRKMVAQRQQGKEKKEADDAEEFVQQVLMMDLMDWFAVSIHFCLLYYIALRDGWRWVKYFWIYGWIDTRWAAKGNAHRSMINHENFFPNSHFPSLMGKLKTLIEVERVGSILLYLVQQRMWYVSSDFLTKTT